MKQYQSTSDIVVSRQTPETTATTIQKITVATKKSTRKKKKLIKNSVKSHPIEIKSSLRPESRSSSIASTLSLHNGSVDSYWPEFHQNYHSIMDNTNLLDSCAAALSDITYDDESTLTTESRDAKFGIFFMDSGAKQSIGSSNGSSGYGEVNSVSGKNPSPKDIELFTRWLCEMELRVARQPTSSQIFAMNSNDTAQLLNIYSKILNDIAAQPCIVKGSARSDYKSIEERYHLLYLKAYEAVLLLGGLPIAGKQSNSNKIMSRSFYDVDSLNNVTEEENSSECENTNQNNLPYSSQSKVSEPVSHRPNISAVNYATYYFSYEQKEQPLSNKQVANQLNQSESMYCDSPLSEINSLSIDKELTFSTFNDNEIQSFLDCSENSVINNIENCSSITHALEQSSTSESKESGQHFDFYFDDLMRSPALHQFNEGVSMLTVSTENLENKVQNWLKCSNDAGRIEKFGSSWSMERFPLQNDRQVLYKSRSELDLRQNGATSDKWPSLHTSINRLPRFKSSSILSSINSSFDDLINDNLEWDNFQSEYELQSQQSTEEIADDARMSTLARKLCEFGNDYSLFLNTSSVSVSVGDDDDAKEDELLVSENKNLQVKEAEFKIRRPLRSKTTTPRQRYLLNRRVKQRLRRRSQTILMRSQTSIASTPISTSCSLALSSTSETSVSTLTSLTSKSCSKPFVPPATFSVKPRKPDSIVGDEHDTFNITAETLINQNLSSSSPEMNPSEATESTPEASKIKNTAMNSLNHPPKIIKYDSVDDNFEIFTADNNQPIRRKVSELKPEDFYDIIKICQANIDCVITVLGTEANRELAVHYSQKTKKDKVQSDGDNCVCRKRVVTKPKDDPLAIKVDKQRDQVLLDKFNALSVTKTSCDSYGDQSTCLCAWISEQVAMIFEFVLDFWNVLRNMRLYFYLCKVVQELFGSSRYVAQYLKAKRNLMDSKAIGYL